MKHIDNSNWQGYPRPQMRRDTYKILNGTWSCNGQEIQVPYPPQSDLSGYKGEVEDILLYEKTFVIPEDFTKERILLHFGAVDQVAEVWVNDIFLGRNEGGYLPFSFDMTDAVHRVGENVLKVKATDTLDLKYPYGKQCKKRGGMWYTPVSGIWKTVWMENVPDTYIEKVKITPDLTGIDVNITLTSRDKKGGLFSDGENTGEIKVDYKETKLFTARIVHSDGRIQIHQFEGVKTRIEIENPHLWDTENPHLYFMSILFGHDEDKNNQDELTGNIRDRVETYFALRTIGIENINGINRVCLNGKPIFLHGVLDQGYFPEGIYMPKEDGEFEQDVLRMKALGFNMLRKHIKIEPEEFYYACDKHGMLVVQDMVNSGSYSWTFDTALPTIGFKKKRDRKSDINGERQRIFKEQMEKTIEHLYNHPSIVVYTIFNEGWGQFHSDAMYDLAKSFDNSRLYDSTSGWFAQKKNDFDSEHIYFKVIDLKVKERPMFVSECGGYALPVEGHLFNPDNEYGYGKCKDSEDLTARIEHMYKKMIIPAIKKGACGCVYTQLSDVEDEVNGLYTYDRQVCKVVKEQMLQVAKSIYEEIDNL